VELSRRFASRRDDRFGEGAWAPGGHGAPVLAGCAAVFECETVSQQVAGDHVLFIGRVHAASEAPVAPLLFQAGHYRLLGEVL
jgi:4-hydroxyphenylacetate 3-hydroxylase, reductase component